ncbi:S-adenosyl-L-methionine-dependent methyltransferases superfamily protein [Tasmannia lanceolata]|uniref:S-adenosyl-L-methionine-dependent methyltransferases superfamily protein n=1 Tax=Tasmannia lanceolata TaxID=3420 RepID=UPI0040631653
MGCFATAPSAAIPHSPSPIRLSKKKTFMTFVRVRAKLHDDEDPLLQAASHAAYLRFQETHRPDPLFIDPYAGCFLTAYVDKDMKPCLTSVGTLCHYCLATKFIDDQLISTVKHMDGHRQIVLLTDGMDTRPYRLNWPLSTIIFDISPARVFKIASERLGGIGAKISRTCLLVHVPLETFDIHGILHRKGFTGERPSIWVLQGLPVRTLASFKEILFVVSSLAMKGCIFVGELPLCFVKTEFGTKSNTQKWMDKLFISHGFRVDVVAYDKVARDVNRDPPSGDYENILFVAQQLQLSDDQMETWRREFQRLEEEGDEDGFEEL